jgi:bacterioferritin
MGTKAKELVKMDVNKVIELLNKAYADEWLAYYQYWIGAKVVTGQLRGAAQNELMEHANEELGHAEMIANRIITLGGTPVLKPEDWYKVDNCGYEAPEDPSVKTIIQQNIKGEQCAIDVYHNLLEVVKDKDIVTYKMVLEILEDEIEHEEDLQAILEDMR